MIVCKGLTKQYKDLVALRDLTMTISQGDIFGYIGPNGAGKTTTIKILATLIKPTSGYAEICNCNVLTQPDDVKRVIGYMPDFFGVYDDMKVWEYLDFFGAAYKIDRAKRRKIIDDVLEITDLTGKKNDFVEALSRGMKQRLCLAKTLVHDPQVLLLDEPASGLDPRARIEMRELLKELRRLGKTILISSHILTELADFCNTIGILERGELLAAGEVSAIMGQMEGARKVEITIRDAARASEAHDLLTAHGGVRSVQIDGNEIVVDVDVTVDDVSFINELLLANGIKITAFRESEVDLEDIFMKITKGAVQ
ncbi:MAG: ABC transporter ATP-binding protein [Candidatus Sumerlaeia bacterium]|nr:ABC transporter ATP-binding protein [Candidatus Sumerlaeia bacterium]